MQEFIEEISQILIEETGLSPEEIKLERPKDPKLGDLAFPCFPLAKILRKAPPKIAGELAEKLANRLENISVKPIGPYLNFYIERKALAQLILTKILDQKHRYGCANKGEGKKIIVDFSSPNIAKPMHVGHLRSTIIGASIKRLYESLGYQTIGINHIGDWGSQFGKLVTAIKRWGNKEALEKNPIQTLLDLYVRYHDNEENDPSLKEESNKNFQELESGKDGDVRATWRQLTELSMKEFQKVYDRLQISFDFVRGESFYEPYLTKTIDTIKQTGISEISKGALVVSLEKIEENMPPCILRKTDGTTIYATRDLAAVFHRWQEFQFTKCLYVVGSEQKLHFRQIKGVLQRMELSYEPRVEHIDFGRLRLPKGQALSTRKGQVIFLEDLLNEAVQKAKQTILEKNPNLASIDEVAEQVGVGAVIFHDLKKERIKDVVFDWEQVLSFKGETGPYVQYTHARLSSILRKAPNEAPESLAAPVESIDWILLEDATSILLLLGRFSEVIRSAAHRKEPSEVSQYVFQLCTEINSWYHDHKVLDEEGPLTAARLLLVNCCKIVIANSLKLLGLVPVEEM